MIRLYNKKFKIFLPCLKITNKMTDSKMLTLRMNKRKKPWPLPVSLTNINKQEKLLTVNELYLDVLEQVIAKCVAGASIAEVCAFGDNEIEKEVKKCFTKDKKMEKGVGFPTCVSVNNIVGHYSPLKSEDSQLKEGDLAKIDLGVQIDGFVGCVAHTIVVGQKAVSDKKADVVLAAYKAIEASLRLMKPGHYNHEVNLLNFR